MRNCTFERLEYKSALGCKTSNFFFPAEVDPPLSLSLLSHTKQSNFLSDLQECHSRAVPRQLLGGPGPHPGSEFPLPRRMPNSTAVPWLALGRKSGAEHPELPWPRASGTPSRLRPATSGCTFLRVITLVLSGAAQRLYLLLSPINSSVRSLQKRSDVACTVSHHA